MVRRSLAAVLGLVLALTGCGKGSDPEQVVISALRDVEGVKKVWTVPWLIRSPDYVFVVEMADPTPEALAGVIRAYGSTVQNLPSDDVEIYLRWRAGEQDREIKGWGFVMPKEEYVRAAADWPDDLTIRAGFYPAQGFVVSVHGDDAGFPALLSRVAAFGLKGDEAGVYSDRYKVGWDTEPPVARFEAARAAAPTASTLRVYQRVDGVVGDTLSGTWAEPATAESVRPELEAMTDLWAESPKPLELSLRVGKDRVAYLKNNACPDPSLSEPLNVELWAYAQRPGHRIVLAPDC